jgi:hypothetical protein
MQVTILQCFWRLTGEKLWKSEMSLSSTNSSKGARMSKSLMKKTLITFFEIKATVHFEYIPQG